MADAAGSPGPEVALEGADDFEGVEIDPLRSWLADLLGELAPEADTLAVRFLDERSMRELNASFRAIDRATDVLSFPGEKTPEGLHLGDIAIAVPIAERQAAELDHSLGRELRCLLLHGVLHCLGHDHEADDGEMDRIELALRERWVGDP